MSSQNFAFLTKASFLGVPENQSACAYAVAGIAYDGATTNRPGARFGPHAIRRASHMLCDGVHPANAKRVNTSRLAVAKFTPCTLSVAWRTAPSLPRSSMLFVTGSPQQVRRRLI